jgi:hypothetical protein
MKTTRSIFFFLCTILSIGNLSAQKFNFGVQVGSNFAVQSQIGDYYNNEDIRVGLHSGIFTKLALKNKVSIQAEINYDQLGSNSADVKNSYDYLNVPILVNYLLGKSDLTPLNFDLYAGPYAGYLLKAESHISTNEMEQTTDQKDNTNKFTGGIILGFGLRYPVENQNILLDIRLGLGLEPYDKANYEPKNKYIGISLGYQF